MGAHRNSFEVEKIDENILLSITFFDNRQGNIKQQIFQYIKLATTKTGNLQDLSVNKYGHLTETGDETQLHTEQN